MLRISPAKAIGVALLVLAGVIYTLPSVLSPAAREGIKAATSWMPQFLQPHRAVVLGLDLQGGIHLLLQVDAPAVQRTQVTGLRDDVRRVLREENAVAQGGIALEPRGVRVVIPDAAARARVLPKLRALSQPVGNAALGTGVPSVEVTEGEGGLLRAQVTEAGINDRVRKAVDQSIEVIRRRIDPEGTKEPNIQRQGLDRVLLQIPGAQNSQEVADLIRTTAQLQFRFVAEPGAAPGDVEVLPSTETGGTITLERQVIVQGDDLIDAQPAVDQQRAEPIVNFKFNLRGAQRFGAATSANVGRLLAIVLDNKVISAPRIQSPITGGQGQISGRFTVETATKLAVLLRAGALPAPLTVVEERTVGPGLGADSIDAGKTASLWATVLVMGFMVVSYGLFGLFANIALAVHVLLIFALMSTLGATLTLPGIAGIVLTIGTAVDSNVLIYERIREEVRAGRSIVSALEAGFTRAFSTIIDSNVTMLIAAVLLYLLGSGPVRGFAVTLVLGIITTVVTAVTMTRMMIAVWYRARRPQVLPF